MTVSSYIFSFLATIALELPTAYLFGLRSKNSLLVVVLANLTTQPALNFVFDIFLFIYGNTNVSLTLIIVIILEVFVVVIEWQILTYILKREPIYLLTVTFIINLVSFLPWLLFNYL